jgi:anti-sigma regulatory factor (Ser/Thr protein kinase)
MSDDRIDPQSSLLDLLALSDLLGRSADPRDAARLELLRCEADELVESLRDMLDRAAGATDRPAIAFRLESVVAEASAMGAHGAVVTTACSDGLPRVVRGDAGRLRRVVAHLVRNAVAAASDGDAEILVDVSPTAGRDMVRIEVSDTAHGMTADRLATARSALAGDESTAGLGLHVTGDLVRLLGGTAAIDSAPGCGTAVTVTVPLAAATLPSRELTLVPGQRTDDAAAVTAPVRFLDSVMRHLLDLDAALERCDFFGAAHIGQLITERAWTFGAVRLSELAAGVQDACDARDVRAARALFGAMGREFHDVSRGLQPALLSVS